MSEAASNARPARNAVPAPSANRVVAARVRERRAHPTMSAASRRSAAGVPASSIAPWAASPAARDVAGATSSATRTRAPAKVACRCNRTANPNNNLCCWQETTLCPSSNQFGRSGKCCRPQGGHCSTGLDCCQAVSDLQFGRDTCGDDGVCGGKGAYCGTGSDCVDGRECWGACFGTGIGFQLCRANSDCPAGSLCAQRRCAYRTELPPCTSNSHCPPGTFCQQGMCSVGR